MMRRRYVSRARVRARPKARTQPADGSRHRLAVMGGYNWKAARKVFDSGPVMEIFQQNNLQEGIHYNVVDGQPVPLVPSAGDNQAHNISMNMTSLHASTPSMPDRSMTRIDQWVGSYGSAPDVPTWADEFPKELDEEQDALRSGVKTWQVAYDEKSAQLGTSPTNLRNELAERNPVEAFETKLIDLDTESTSTESPSLTRVSRKTTTAAELLGQLGHKRGLEDLALRDNTIPPTKKLRVNYDDPAILSSLAFDLVKLLSEGISIIPPQLKDVLSAFDISNDSYVSKAEHKKPFDLDEFFKDIHHDLMVLLHTAIHVLDFVATSTTEHFFKQMYGSDILDTLCEDQEITWNTLRASYHDGSMEAFQIVSGNLREAISYLFVAGVFTSTLWMRSNKPPEGRIPHPPQICIQAGYAWETYHDEFLPTQKLGVIDCPSAPKYNPASVSEALVDLVAQVDTPILLVQAPVSRIKEVIKFGFPSSPKTVLEDWQVPPQLSRSQ
ncbi:hypothetical protein SLS62_007596 [Diatrype stigma]|uniref:Uncharacterized protein n=1 Tax=Diatrype stigma TaxID=117547 RepID=A0AAN9UNP5_9PEZI